MVTLKKLIIASVLLAIFASTPIQAANPGDPITAINFGEYATFGGSTWRKARYYDHDSFVSSEQGYFIRLYDDSYVGAYGSSDVFATSTLATSTLPTFYTNMSDTNNIKSQVLTTSWSVASTNLSWTSPWKSSIPGSPINTLYYSGKIAVPSVWEVANNSEIFGTATANYFWSRTPASASNGVWITISSSFFYGSYVSGYSYRVVPSLRLSSTQFLT